MATNLFIEDKRAYIFDSSVLISSSLATQIKMEIKSFKRTIDPILEGVNHTNFKFNDFSKNNKTLSCQSR